MSASHGSYSADGTVHQNLILDNMNPSQYERLLELMLELERKMEKAILETRQETGKAILDSFDVVSFRRDVDNFVEDKIQLVESKFESLYG